MIEVSLWQQMVQTQVQKPKSHRKTTLQVKAFLVWPLILSIQTPYCGACLLLKNSPTLSLDGFSNFLAEVSESQINSKMITF